jgi:ribonuclease D
MRRRELYIDQTAALDEFFAQLDETRLIGLDTEFVREKTYYPLLCLVQLATPTTIACIDCLAELDLRALFDRLIDGDTEWIVHSSRQDLEVIYQHASRLPSRLIDTQIAAGLAGFAPQIGLQDLLAETLDINLPKEYTRTDWSRRPLPEPVLQYARDDVRSLHALWSVLDGKLDALGRREWVAQDCAMLSRQTPLPPVEQIWMKLRGVRGLGTEGAAAAFALVDWREQRARARNRPRRWILSDEHLVAIAKRYPLTIDALRRVPELPNRTIERLGREILEVIRAAEGGPAYEHASALIREDPPDKRQVKALQEAARTIAEGLGIHAEVFATKQEIVELIKGREPPRFSETWRAQYLGELTRRL